MVTTGGRRPSAPGASDGQLGGSSDCGRAGHLVSKREAGFAHDAGARPRLRGGRRAQPAASEVVQPPLDLQVRFE